MIPDFIDLTGAPWPVLPVGIHDSALPDILIQARIAAGMSQTKLARELGLKPQQVQRYEATNLHERKPCQID